MKKIVFAFLRKADICLKFIWKSIFLKTFRPQTVIFGLSKTGNSKNNTVSIFWDLKKVKKFNDTVSNNFLRNLGTYLKPCLQKIFLFSNCDLSFLSNWDYHKWKNLNNLSPEK